MRTLDRETRELQEKQWIYLLHQQNPPLTRQATPAPLDLTGLMPTSISGSGLTTPTHLPSLSTSSFPSPHQADGYPPSFAWTQTLTPIAKVTATSMQFGGMVKHTPKPLSFQPSPVHFRALLTKSTPTSKSSKTHEKEMVKRSVLPKKCDFPMCQNSSRSRGFCYSHGGGRRCRMDGCANGAVSRDLCKRHGGGRRCRMVDCKSSAESGGLCYSHGGGRRCQLDWCVARAKKGGYCSLHINNPDAPPPSSKKKKEVVESLLYLSRQEKENETSSTRLLNPYALASILN